MTEPRPSLCPYCGYFLDAASAPFSDARPEPGDVSMCLGCGEILLFAPDMTSVKMTPEAWAGLGPEGRRLLKCMQRARKQVVPEGGIPNKQRKM